MTDHETHETPMAPEGEASPQGDGHPGDAPAGDAPADAPAQDASSGDTGGD